MPLQGEAIVAEAGLWEGRVSTPQVWRLSRNESTGEGVWLYQVLWFEFVKSHHPGPPFPLLHNKKTGLHSCRGAVSMGGGGLGKHLGCSLFIAGPAHPEVTLGMGAGTVMDSFFPPDTKNIEGSWGQAGEEGISRLCACRRVCRDSTI
jgi:hypothetical protein